VTIIGIQAPGPPRGLTFVSIAVCLPTTVPTAVPITLKNAPGAWVPTLMTLGRGGAGGGAGFGGGAGAGGGAGFAQAAKKGREATTSAKQITPNSISNLFCFI